MKKLKVIELTVPIFRQEFLILIGNPKEANKELERRFNGLSIELDSDGESSICEIKNKGGEVERFHCVWLRSADIETMTHEATHASLHIMDNIGVPISKDNHEVIAYLTGYISSEILKSLRKKKS